MRSRRLTWVLLPLVTALAPALSAEPRGPHPLDPAAVERLMAASGGKADVRLEPATGAARFVRLPAAGPVQGLVQTSADATSGKTNATAKAKSMAFLKLHGSAFGVTDPDSELVAAGESTDRTGRTHLTFNQVYQGVPVFGGVLKTHFDAARSLTVVNGIIVPQIDLDPHPTKSAAVAGRRAVATVVAALLGDSASGAPVPSGLTVQGRRLLVFRTGLLQHVPGENHLAWEIEVGNGGDVRQFVYVDAHSGKVLDRIDGIFDGLNRRAFNGGGSALVPPPNYPATPFWVEGNPFPTGTTEADNMIISSEETWGFYHRAFGRDSFDGLGGTMDAIFNRGNACPNASWNGTFISFCPGLTTDDVTAHEWSHAYTQYTHGLIYQWQSGALNESYSDVWGETVDRINGRGGDVPATARTAGACSSFQAFARIIRVNSPAAIAGDYAAATASFGPPVAEPGITGDVVYTVPPDACTAITNAAAVAGKIALVDRGGVGCGFTLKVKNAQLAGATAVIVADNVAGALAGMSGADPTITIPSLRVTLATGNIFKTQLAAPVNATLKTSAPPLLDNSIAWILGEDDTAVGLAGPLRDMYNPPCLGNPGKISDPLYSCSAGDNGGVHNNSGVGNHTYALLVDGGTYNGQTVAGIGLTKAAHVYYRAQSVYQTPITDYADHADALTQSCADLIGVNLTDLATGTPSGQALSAADCAEVEHAILATEMRNPPVQCAFVPLLSPGPPDRCPVGATQVNVFATDFESSPATWTVSHDAVVAAAFTPRDWRWAGNLPSQRSGSAFFAPNPNIGACNPTANQAGVLHLDSPAITLPSGVATPLLTFDHWVATEVNFDGGNLKVSVNGGPYQLVAAAAYTFNPYNRTLLTAAAGNTDPMAGEPAFSGTDGGSVGGSWARSHVNLTGYALPGDSVRLRFDLGCDCGTGRFGWFLDDPTVYACVSSAVPTVSLADATVVEGDNGFTTMTFIVSLSAPTTRQVTVHYKTAQGAGDTGTAKNGTDYLPENGSVTFPALSLNTQQTFTVRIKTDTKREADEYFFVDLSSPTNATLGDSRGQGNILNDD